MDSIEKTIKQLRKLQENVKKIEGKHSFTFKELFNDEFVSQHTKFSNISDFLEPSGLDFSSQESFRNVDIKKLDEYISANSDFSSWEDMKSCAAKILLNKQLYS